MSKQITESTEQFLSGGGEMGKLIRTMDWSKTALGPIEEWPQSLRTSVSLCLSSTFPILIAWGPETIQIYNDSYRPICGAKHPQSMGENFRICWETALPVVGDKFTRGQHGEGTYITDQRMFLDRYGYLEETWMTFSFAPIRDESGGVGGIFHPITETTEKMLSARRTQVLKDVGAAIGKAKTVQEIAAQTDALYEAFQLDLPFLLFYELKDNGANLLSAAGLAPGHTLAPLQFDVDDTIWPLQQLVDSGELLEVNGLEELLLASPCGPYDINPHSAIVLPIRITGQASLFGFIIAGVSACRALDNPYLHFYDQLASTFNTAVSNVYAYAMEQKRAEALAEIDRSKTAFFSNVSHEFRTPLTLMLGPLEELLQQQDLQGQHRTQIEATHRNALRLLKLVNNLLDYSRVEAGRAQAIYQKLNLQESTIDLASSFRSIIEKAGMALVVDCLPLESDFYIDKQMWEKIVLNLLSNAFKYTLEGTITVSLRQVGDTATLAVTDTGVGIPEKELPHMFERFHRIENTAGRTHEGTGIGLSLVHELVQLHSGEIAVTSVEGSGSTFTVKIPAGQEHLPQNQVVSNSETILTSEVSGAFIREAYSLLPDAVRLDGDAETELPDNASLVQDNTVDRQTRILIVDDNNDMRAYLKRLLDPFYTVETASNGQEALNRIQQQAPSLILSDVMMPVMDGKAMLQQLRNDEELFRLPVIFLSARAGEEARIDGLEAGADDYLVKPFSAAELLTKVRAQININKARGHATEQLRTLLTEAPVAMAIYRGPKHVIELANQRMLNLWGKTKSEIDKRPLMEILPALREQGFGEVMDRVYQTGKHFVSTDATITLSRNGGTPDIIYLNITIEALRDENGSINGLIAVAADVTEQVLARYELEKMADTLLLAMDSSNMGFYRITVATDFIEVSPRAREIHAIAADTPLTYHQALQFIIPEDRERFSAAIAEAIDTKGGFSLDYQIQPLNEGKRKWINSTGKAELDKNGRVISVVGTIFDITESKEDDLRKNDFIGMVSHELKTPLSSLKGYAQMGLRKAHKASDGFSVSVYEKIEQQVQKMAVLINGFLNVSRLDSGKIQINVTEFCLQETILTAVAEVKLLAPDQPFELHVERINVIADREKIATVITNFLSNAVKYAKNKKVTISCRLDRGNVIVSVKDEGLGIKSTELEKLFDRYYRVEGNNPNISGFGIGLYLSAEIIHRHQGKIWAESDYGAGATFSFSIPTKQLLT
ncbi:ATP-binding protein [Sphingobacterium paludis]|uniref:histidine kinase n=1 Tax=Sphingobacterium paludis TaxID=1476465 RepID=A0A4R7D161_9SPHI|nr:ATP-binding protein [Sphingobacterium paludis]TDS14693.1 PAS domain S-box-containing protein [Sphingobacterium paludis]